MSAPPEASLRRACDTLAARDEALARAYTGVGLPEWRTVPATYATLARAVTFQLISLQAAGAIWTRTQALFAGPIDAKSMLDMPEDDLRGAGNSRPKIGHMKSIALAVTSGELDFQRLENSHADAAYTELLAVKGIGPWTANLFLLTALGHMDAFPHGDVGIMEAHRDLIGAEKRLRSKEFSELAETWTPYRGAAAHLLWGWWHLQRDT